MTDLSGYLYYRFPFGTQVEDEWRTTCPFCGNEKNKCFINMTSGASWCHHCNWKVSGWVGLIASVEGVSGKEIGRWIATHKEDLHSPLSADKSYRTARIQMRLNLPSHCVPVEQEDAFSQYLWLRRIPFQVAAEFRMHKCLDGKYKNRLIIPVFENGQLMYFYDRTIDPTDERKTLGIGTHDAFWPVNKSEVVFNLDKARGQQRIIVAEGIISALSLSINRAVALLGKSCSEKQLKKLLDIGAEEVEVCLDADALHKSMELADALSSWGLKTFIRCFKKNSDPNDYLVNHWELPPLEVWDLRTKLKFKMLNPQRKGAVAS